MKYGMKDDRDLHAFKFSCPFGNHWQYLDHVERSVEGKDTMSILDKLVLVFRFQDLGFNADNTPQTLGDLFLELLENAIQTVKHDRGTSLSKRKRETG